MNEDQEIEDILQTPCPPFVGFCNCNFTANGGKEVKMSLDALKG